MGRLRWQLRGAAAEGGKAAPEKEFMYGTLSRFKLRHTRGGKAALRPLTKISRISIIKRFLGSIFVLFCTPKKHITDVTFVFLTAFPVVTASRFCTRGSRFTRFRLLLFTFAKKMCLWSQATKSRQPRAVLLAIPTSGSNIFKMRRGLRRAVLLPNGQGLGGLRFY